jgi:hypothetical protein
VDETNEGMKNAEGSSSIAFINGSGDLTECLLAIPEIT